MPGRNRKSPYESYRNGQWTLLGVTAVTAVNLLLALLLRSSPIPLFFPFSAWIPRDFLLRGREAAGAAGSAAAYAFFLGCALLFCAYILLTVCAYRSDRFPAIRTAFLLYAADTAYYFVLSALPGILRSGFSPASVIELLFRAFVLYQLYQADRVFLDPERKNPHAKAQEELTPPPEEEEDGEDEEDDDEGIQW